MKINQHKVSVSAALAPH